MQSKIYLLAFFLLVFISCSEDDHTSKQALTYSDFELNLKADMTYDSIVATFGAPSNDIGSGIHVYVYKLSDSSEIWIGYTDEIIYARQMDSDQEIIKVII